MAVSLLVPPLAGDNLQLVRKDLSRPIYTALGSAAFSRIFLKDLDPVPYKQAPTYANYIHMSCDYPGYLRHREMQFCTANLYVIKHHWYFCLWKCLTMLSHVSLMLDWLDLCDNSWQEFWGKNKCLTVGKTEPCPGYWFCFSRSENAPYKNCVICNK